jgi:plastocyanin
MARFAFAMAALIGAIALGGSALAANAAVAMSGAQFVPSAVTVNVGDSVTWTNQDGIPHSARADNGSFDTGVFSTGSRSVTLAQAGSFGYFCAVHPSTMRGTVNVVGAATPPPPTPPPATLPPTPAPTAPPSVRPTPAPPTVVPSTPTPSPAPSPTPAPTSTPAATSVSPTPTAVALQVSPTPAATASPNGSSRSGDGGPPLLLIGGIAAVLALAGAAFALSRRG